VWLSPLSLRVRLAVLTAASYAFYGWWDSRFTLLMFASTLLDWHCGQRIDAARAIPRQRRRYLLLAVAGNLLVLAVFKYLGFFVESVNGALTQLGVEASLPTIRLILPVGISFYTFQSMSYSIDIYRGEARPAPDFLHFAAYVALFPQLVAGPIVRYANMADQLRNLDKRSDTHEKLAYGSWLFVMGLSKKLLVADKLAPAATALFDSHSSVQFVTAWYGSLSYSMQLYFDFSGYSDMAIGLGLLFGFRFPINFDSPYRAPDIASFWNRWHITLSHFLRDYLFIPLGGSRGGPWRTMRNLVLTMALGGLWHGAQWTFVLWGLYHGVLLVAHAARVRTARSKWPKEVCILATFLMVHLGWVLFRAPSFGRALEVWKAMGGLAGFEPSLFLSYQSFVGPLPLLIHEAGGLLIFSYPFLALAIAWTLPNLYAMRVWASTPSAVVTAILAVTCLYSLAEETPFLYFQF
jgi:alginate O-acetyltransferase complex protein AlgI